MNITLKEITIRDLVKGYKDNDDEGVVGYGGKLDIRPPYQREFIYKDNQRNAVIDTVKKNFPLNVMYWADRGDGSYEIIYGQQRTISVCQYKAGDFSYDGLYFHNLQDDVQNKFLDYKLKIYICEGSASEKLDWFKIINIAGEKLTDQELLNAIYPGSWVTDAKKYFSKRGCPAYNIANNYVKGSTLRQEYLETATKWISKGKIEEYMGKHQNDKTAGKLWRHFENVISWIKAMFTNTRKKFMIGVEWGKLYDEFKDRDCDPKELEAEIAKLILDDDVTNKKGIYFYVLTRDEKHLSIRIFTDSMKQSIYEKQKGICSSCDKKFELEEMEADHITPWSEGGKTEESNCQMLCRECNRRKGKK